MLNKVAVNGVDTTTDLKELAELSREFPFVEWGILFSRNPPRLRYPPEEWVNTELRKAWNGCKSMKLCMHLCGDYAREICNANWKFLDDLLIMWTMADRVQVNIRNIMQNAQTIYWELRHRLYHGIHEYNKRNTPIIIQTDSFQSELLREEFRFNCVQALYDMSGGTGALPGDWPANDVKFYCGYGGGLNPENVEEQIQKISEVAKRPYWIDVESGVRTKDKFDIVKTRDFLEKSAKYVVQ